MSIHNIIMAAAGSVGQILVASAQNQLTSSSTSLAISKPTGTISGDIMVAVTATAQPGSNMNQLSGWTRVLTVNSDNKLTVQYKIAGGSEPSSYTFTSGSSQKMSGCIATFRNVSYDKIGSANTNAGSGQVGAPSITPTLNNSILLAIYASEEAGTTLVQPSGMTLVATDHPDQGGTANAPCFAVFYQKNVAASATGTKNCTLENSGQVSGVLMALSPA